MLDRLSDTNRRAFLDGIRTLSPAVAATFSWGLVTGIAMAKSVVLTVPQALGMSIAVYAGSSQLAVLPLFAAKLPVWTILLTAAMVNLRFVIFSAGLAPHFSYLPMWRRLVLGYFNGDIIYLMFAKRNFPTGFQPGKEAFFWGLAVTSWSSWQVSSIAGILLASLFPDDWGLELAGTLALLPLIVSAIATRSTLAAVGIASIVALLAFDLPYRIGLPIAVLAALAAGSIADMVIARVAPDRARKPHAPAASPATRETPPGESAPTRPDTTRSAR
ncbi:AzlC family ABC transporter permease [Caballeronia telluris]|uniref:AzlC family protein n=1 Tax=Caballeronia telluris TaxID=326475 RepID=A0A158IZY3_9BURK|nr:AzlC family ABC transporter permease [Caballeronia telluris]SAL62242.1 AzlC family protein [Caballeronia telluris]